MSGQWVYIKPIPPIRHIRKNIFHVTQADFAELAGVAQSTVSRWENGMAPSFNEMRSIRQAAFARGIRWKDSWFFEIPGR